MIVVAQLVYHLSVKAAPRHLSPFVLIAIAYGVGVMLMLGAAISMRANGNTDALNITPGLIIRGVIIGLAVSVVEVGYVLAYRQGLSLAFGGLSIFAVTTVLLAALSYGVSSRPTFTQIVGAAMVVAGLALVLRR